MKQLFLLAQGQGILVQVLKCFSVQSCTSSPRGLRKVHANCTCINYKGQFAWWPLWQNDHNQRLNLAAYRTGIAARKGRGANDVWLRRLSSTRNLHSIPQIYDLFTAVAVPCVVRASNSLKIRVEKLLKQCRIAKRWCCRLTYMGESSLQYAA